MGEIADDLVEGLVCSGCGIYFQGDHGHPVLCMSCHQEEKRELNCERKSGQARRKPELPQAYNKEL